MNRFTRQLVSDLRDMPHAMWVLVGGQFINRFGCFVHPFLALYLTQKGFSLGQLAVVLGAISCGQLAAPFAAGYLADAIGRRNTIVVSLIGSALTVLGLYACVTLPQLLVMAMLNGFLTVMYGPAASALVTDLVGAEKRVIAYALLRLAINAGFAAGPSVAGLLFTRAPALIFFGDAASSLAFAALAWMFLPHGLRSIHGPAMSPALVARSWLEAARSAFADRRFVQLLVALQLMTLAFAQVFHVLSLHTRDRGLSPSTYGLIMGFNGLLIVLIELPLCQWAQRFGERRVLMVGFATVGLGCCAFGFADSPATFLAAMFVFTVGEMMSLPIASAYSSRLAPAQMRGRYFGFHGVVWSLAGFAGSAGVWFHGHMGATWWYCTGLLAIVAGFAMTLRVREGGVGLVAPIPDRAV